MSSRSRITSTMKAPDFANFVDSRLLSQVQSQVVETVILPLIEVGASPVQGFGRFPAYKNPEKYPGSRKGKRPVNLYLSGDMLKHYGAFNGKTMKSIFMGINPRAPKDITDRAVGNNYGMNGIPERRFVPAAGETFKASILLALKDVFSGRVKQLLKTSGLRPAA